MPISTRAMLTDKDGNFIPQAWDPAADAFVPLLGTGAGISVVVPAPAPVPELALKEQMTEGDAAEGVVTFGAPVVAIDIYNRADTDGTFLVDGVAILVPAGAGYGPHRVGNAQSAQVRVTGSSTFIMGRFA